jgi:RNA binding exosome subunit
MLIIYRYPAVNMGVHHISWQSTSSGIEDEYIHAAALAWLIGDEEAVNIERMDSFHGTPIHVITAEIKRRGPATKSLARLGQDTLNLLKDELDQRMDENNVIHIRLDLLDLLSGKITLTVPGERPTVKGRAKLEVYPGNTSTGVAIETIDAALQDSLRLGLPESPRT